MRDEISELLNKIMQLKHGKSGALSAEGCCLNEEQLACYVDGKYPEDEYEGYTKHIMSCGACSETILDYGKALLSEDHAEMPPQMLIKNAQGLVEDTRLSDALDVIISIKNAALDLIKTTGEVILGNSLASMPAMRNEDKGKQSQNIRLVKKISNYCVDIEIQKKKADTTSIVVRMSEEETNIKADKFRVSLNKKGRELESLMSENGKVQFEEVKIGGYQFVIEIDGKKIGKINLSLESDDR